MLDSLLAAYFLLQLFDGWTTYEILLLGGYERNPLVRMAMETLGIIPALILYKALGIVAGVLVYSTGYVWPLGAMTVFMLGICTNNCLVLRRLDKQ